MSEIIREEEVAEEYRASLADLVINSKPLITVLTMLAEENKECAKVIVECIEKHLMKMQAEVKLPTMYLIDSIVKNVGHSYVGLFTENIDKIFEHVFKQVSEPIRAQLFKLRQTWSGIFPVQKLHKLDILIHAVDPGWPIVSPVTRNLITAPSTNVSSHYKTTANTTDAIMKDSAKEELLRKQKELLQLKQKKLELEIRQTKALLQKQGINTSSSSPTTAAPASNISSVTSTDTKSDTHNLHKTTKTQVSSAVSNVPVNTSTTSSNTVQPVNNSSVRINPVSMELINAAQRVRDPRLRRLELDRIKLNSNSDHNKECNKSSSHENANISDKKRSTESSIPSSAMIKPSTTMVTVTITAATTSAIISTTITTQPVVVNTSSSRRVGNPNSVRNDISRKINAPSGSSEFSLRNSSITTAVISGTNVQPSAIKINKPVESSKVSESVLKRKKLDSDKDNVELRISRKLAKRRLSHRKDRLLARKPSTSIAEIIIDDNDDNVENPIAKSENVPVVNAVKLLRNSGISEDLLKGNTNERERRLAIIKALSVNVKNLSKPLNPPLDIINEPTLKEIIDAENSETGNDLSKITSPQNTLVKEVEDNAPFAVATSKRHSTSPVTNLALSKRNKSNDEDDTEQLQGHVSLLTRENEFSLKKRSSDGADSNFPVKKSKVESDERWADDNRNSISGDNSNGRDDASKSTSLLGRYSANQTYHSDDHSKLNLKENRSGMSVHSHREPYPRGLDKSTTSYKLQNFKTKIQFPEFSHSAETDFSSPRTNHDSDNNEQKLDDDKSVDNDEINRNEQKSIGNTSSVANNETEPNSSSKNDEKFKQNIKLTSSSEQLTNIDDLITLPSELKSLLEPSTELQQTSTPVITENIESITTNFTADVDIRSLFANLPPTLSPPVVNSSDNNDQPSTCAESSIDMTEKDKGKIFDNPFGIELSNNDENSKDVDYRRMFFSFSASTAANMPNTVSDNFPLVTTTAVVDSLSSRNSVSSNSSTSGNENTRSIIASNHDSDRTNSSRSSSRSSYVSDFGDCRSSENDQKPLDDSLSPYSPSSNIDTKIPTPPLPPPILDVADIELPSTLLPPPPLSIPYAPPLSSSGICAPPSTSTEVAVPEIPPSNPFLVKNVEECAARSININEIPREIRFYDSVAIIFLSWDDPREITFYDGIRNIVVDNRYVIPLYLNRPDKEVIIDGERYRLRLGAPTKEIFVNGIGYECQFNGPSILVNFGPRLYSVKLEGPPPSVNIGTVRRLDFVAGKINIIIDSKNHFSLFLDAKPQKISIGGLVIIVQFVDNLRRILLNEVPFLANYNGLPQSFWFVGKRYFFQLSALPPHIRPGFVNIQNMLQTRLPSPPPVPPSLRNAANNISAPIKVPSLDAAGATQSLDLLLNTMITARVPMSRLSYNSNDDPEKSSASKSGIITGNTDSNPEVINNSTTTEVSSSNDVNIANLHSSKMDMLDISELIKKLVASGMVPNTKNSTSTNDNKLVQVPDITKPDSLKQFPQVYVTELVNGVQCNTCGLRFSANDTIKYSRHLDRHFRLNRKFKNRVIPSRALYCVIAEWLQLEVMDYDDEDKVQSWFETQQNEPSDTEEKEEVLPSVAVGENANMVVCELCLDKFDQFYHDETEEWYLKNAIKADNRFYHPICHESHIKKSEEIINLEDEDEEEIEPVVITDKIELETEEQNVSNETNEQNTEDNQEEIIEDKEHDEEKHDDVNLTTEVETDKDVEIVKIKEEKIDLSNESVVKINVQETPEKVDVREATQSQDENEDSDLEEVQLIEQPIEQIVIHDDVEPNLETLNVEEIIAVPTELEENSSGIVDESVDLVTMPSIDKVVDITNIGVAYSMDGNIEIEDGGGPKIVSGATKIKINIGKPSTSNGNINNNSSSSNNNNNSSNNNNNNNGIDHIDDDEINISNVDDNDKTTDKIAASNFGNVYNGSSEPPPPGVEVFNSAKPKLLEKSLTTRPRLKKGKDVSGLCVVM